MLRTLGIMSTHEETGITLLFVVMQVKSNFSPNNNFFFFFSTNLQNVIWHGHKELQITYKSTSKQSNPNPTIELVKVDIFAKWKIMKIGLLWVRFKLTLNISFKIYMHCRNKHVPFEMLEVILTHVFLFCQRTNFTKKQNIGLYFWKPPRTTT